MTDYLKQPKQPLFDQLRLSDGYSDEEIALIFERDKDTGRNIDLFSETSDQVIIKTKLNQNSTLEQMLETFAPELHGGEFP
ncbi:MAG: hypothetical protein ACK6BS_05675 [Pseudanabaena sp.]